MSESLLLPSRSDRVPANASSGVDEDSATSYSEDEPELINKLPCIRWTSCTERQPFVLLGVLPSETAAAVSEFSCSGSSQRLTVSNVGGRLSLIVSDSNELLLIVDAGLGNLDWEGVG